MPLAQGRAPPEPSLPRRRSARNPLLSTPLLPSPLPLALPPLQSVCPDKAVTVGNYTYLDGELHVRLAVAADAIIESLCDARKSTSVAFLCTPTDIHVIPAEVSAVLAVLCLLLCCAVLCCAVRCACNAVLCRSYLYYVLRLCCSQAC